MSKFILIIVIACSCTQARKSVDPYVWYRETKAQILTESNLPTDSTAIEKYENGKTHKLKSFHQGHPTVEKWYRENGDQVVQTSFSRSGQLELRMELCSDGKPGFEGIFFKDHGYGPSTWWRCGKSKEEEGVRYNDKNIGIWKNWDTAGNQTETNYGHAEVIDSLQWIKE